MTEPRNVPAAATQYGHVNIYVGKYIKPSVPIRLDEAKIRILHGRETAEGFVSDERSKEAWLIVQDGDFWPVMIRLSERDLEELEEALVEW